MKDQFLDIIKNRSVVLWSAGAAVVVVAVAMLWMVADDFGPEVQPVEDRLVVGATIFPLADIVEHVGGERVRVVQVVPAGASPHNYTITPQHLAEMQRAQALFVIGHGLDDWAARGITAVAPVPIVTVDAGIALREFAEEHGHDEEEHADDTDDTDEVLVDPHYWLTIPNGQAMARTVAQHLTAIDPDYGSLYEANLRGYVAELAAAEAELQAMAQAADRRQFVAIHDAWSYFADYYGLELVATYEPVEGKEPAIEDIRALQGIVEQYGIDTFYTEPQKQVTGAIRFLQQDLGLEIMVLDPVGGRDTRQSYIDMMRANMRAIVEE